MLLPKELAKDNLEAKILVVLGKECFEIEPDSKTHIPVLQLTEAIRKNIFYAKCLGELVIGYEAIEKALAGERKGLQNVDNQSERVSRLLLVTGDGSPRFYRELIFLRNKQGGRVLICRMEIDSALMADILGLKETTVKAVLINRKSSVVNLLKSLLTEG